MRKQAGNITLSIVGCVAISISGCGPKAKIRPGVDGALPTHIALLPADYSVDIPKERVDLVRGSVMSELRNRNFIVADDKIVGATCSTPACPERDQLASKYLVDGYATLSLTSFSKNNFVAGYYNQLSGSLVVKDRSGAEVASVDHTESERGGLLFNTGQLFQGIISQVNNSGDAAYKELASEFAKTVVEQLPEPSIATTAASGEALDLALTRVTAEWKSPTTYTVCAKGTPHSFASMLVGTQRTTLREVSPGSYCGAFSALVAAPASTTSAVELRTAFGNSVREDVRLPSQAPCSLENRVRVKENALSVQCSLIGRDPSTSQSGCSETVTLCRAEKIVLFRAASEAGPYEKVSEVTAASTTVRAGAESLALVAVGAGGVPSVPVTVATK